MTMAPPPATTTIDNVFAAIGIEICSYLPPRDLVPLSLANGHLSADVRDNLFKIFSVQQRRRPNNKNNEPSWDDSADSDSSDIVTISDGHSYNSRADVAESLVDKIKAANLRYDPPGSLTPINSLQETLARTQEDLHDMSQWHDGEWCGTFQSDPSEIWKPPQKIRSVCRFGEDLERGRSRRCYTDFMLRQLDGHKNNSKPSRSIARDWARYILAQEGVVGREWQWKVDGEEAVGFMIRTPLGREMEIRLTKKPNKKPELPTLSFRPSLLSSFGF